MKCFECGKGRLQSRNAEVETNFRGEKLSIKACVEMCSKCGFQLVRPDHMGEFGRLVADEYRKRHGLLTGGEIRERREGLSMSQQQFAEYLGVGVASVKRWELGLVQDKAMNELMLLKTDPRKAEENLQNLRLRRQRPERASRRPVGSRSCGGATAAVVAAHIPV